MILPYLLLILIIVVFGQKFDPYVDNGGTIVGVCGEKFTIIAADTRLSDGVINIILFHSIKAFILL